MRADTKTVMIMAIVFPVALALLTVARCDLTLGSGRAPCRKAPAWWDTGLRGRYVWVESSREAVIQRKG